MITKGMLVKYDHNANILDTGTVKDVRLDRALVEWNSGARSWVPLNILVPVVHKVVPTKLERLVGGGTLTPTTKWRR